MENTTRVSMTVLSLLINSRDEWFCRKNFPVFLKNTESFHRVFLEIHREKLLDDATEVTTVSLPLFRLSDN